MYVLQNIKHRSEVNYVKRVKELCHIEATSLYFYYTAHASYGIKIKI